MARELFETEIGILITDENSDSGVSILQGTAAPDGVSGKQGDAAIGSLYIRRDTGELYQKIANAGAAADYQLNGASSATIGTWRGEKVVAATNDTVTAGVARNLSTTPFADDEGTQLTASDFSLGDFIIADADGTPVLLEVTDVSAPSVTFSTPSSAPALAQDDTFVVRNYLPDTPGDQEGQAIVTIGSGGGSVIKVADVDWNFADGISLAATYTPASGNITSADTVQSAVEKLDGNNDAQDQVLGTAQGDTNLGTFSGTTISDNQSVKSALQEVELAHEEVDANVNDLITLSGVAENATNLGTFTGAVIADNSTVKSALQQLESKDETQDGIITEIDANVDDLISLSGVAENTTNLGAFTGFGSILFTATETIKSALQAVADFLGNLRSTEVTSVTTAVTVDEVPVASVGACKWLVTAFEEATPANRVAREIYAINDGTNSDDTVYAKLKLGTTSGSFLTLTTDVSGGNMRLRASSSTAGLTVRARRIAVEDV